MFKTKFFCLPLIFAINMETAATEDFLSGLELEQGTTQTVNPRTEDSHFKELSATELGLKIGVLTAMFMGDNPASENEIKEYCHKTAREILEQEKLSELSEFYKTAPPNAQDAMEPLLDEIKKMIAEQENSAQNEPGSRSLFEFSDLWALPVFNSRFPGYGERKIWLNYKKGRQTRTEIGSSEQEERTQSYLKTTTEELLVPTNKTSAFIKTFPGSNPTGNRKVRIPGGEMNVISYKTTVKKGCTITTNKVTEVEYSWYRLLATPVGNSPLSPVYVKVGEYYIPRTLPGSEAFVTDFNCP